MINNFPSAKVGQAYGFSPDQKWLDHVRMSSIRLARGCSASLVSKDGLVMTNHHCAHSCIEQLSTAQRDYVQTGFYAKEEKDEVKCPDMEANQLIEITDVTERVKAAVAGKDGKAFSDALKAVATPEAFVLDHGLVTADALRVDRPPARREPAFNDLLRHGSCAIPAGRCGAGGSLQAIPAQKRKAFRYWKDPPRR